MKALRRSATSSASPDTNSPSSSSSSSSSPWIHFRSVLFVVASSSPASCSSSSSSDRVHLKSPWSRKKRKHALSPQQWRSFFTPEGKLRDGGAKLLKKVRSGGVDPAIRVEVWPFLLGVYGFCSSKRERDTIKTQNRKKYEKLRRHCKQLIKHSDETSNQGTVRFDTESLSSEDAVSARESLSGDEQSIDSEYSDDLSAALLGRCDGSKRITSSAASVIYSESSDSEYSEEPEENPTFTLSEPQQDPDPDFDPDPPRISAEDFAKWQRIIRLDALRANSEWTRISFSRACCLAELVGLKDYDHLEPHRIFHAARLVAILEAYAVYDPETGYCQGMSDLLSPIITVIEEDHEAFWCFTGFMRKARHNFRLDEVGIRRQLGIVSRIIKCKDAHLYRHLEKLRAEDCFFVYRMVVVLFRRELSYEQTICLWEVMWADQAAIRAGVGGKAAWSRIRQRAPPTDDLLLYAIAASVLQRRKLIIEKYSSMDEIVRECNSMVGRLDVWKLLDDAHNLVMTLQDKIGTSL